MHSATHPRRPPIAWAASVACVAVMGLASARAARAQDDHPAQRLSSIVGVAVGEYAKGVDEHGKLISAEEHSEATGFLRDASEVAGRLPGKRAEAARAVLDTLIVAADADRPPHEIAAIYRRFAAALGSEGALELPAGGIDVAAGTALYEQNCATCHGAAGRGRWPCREGLVDGAAGDRHGRRDARREPSADVSHRVCRRARYRNACVDRDDALAAMECGGIRHLAPRDAGAGARRRGALLPALCIVSRRHRRGGRRVRARSYHAAARDRPSRLAGRAERLATRRGDRPGRCGIGHAARTGSLRGRTGESRRLHPVVARQVGTEQRAGRRFAGAAGRQLERRRHRRPRDGAGQRGARRMRAAAA